MSHNTLIQGKNVIMLSMTMVMFSVEKWFNFYNHKILFKVICKQNLTYAGISYEIYETC